MALGLACLLGRDGGEATHGNLNREDDGEAQVTQEPRVRVRARARASARARARARARA